jgi:hypothetical protein
VTSNMKPLSKPFYLAGVKFSNAHQLSGIPTDTPATIRHNPENKYDAFALEVYIKDTMCGHIPRQEQAAWVYHTLQGVAVTCRVLAWDTQKPPHEQIQVVLECSDLNVTTVVNMNRIAKV